MIHNLGTSIRGAPHQLVLGSAKLIGWLGRHKVVLEETRLME